jgi:hypothetical protein
MTTQYQMAPISVMTPTMIPATASPRSLTSTPSQVAGQCGAGAAAHAWTRRIRLNDA